MPKNSYGFIMKKYRQPDYYRQIFSNYAGIYHTANGTELHFEAVPHFLCSNPINANIEAYRILVQCHDCRRILANGFKSQKAAMEAFEKLFNKYNTKKYE